MRILCSVQDEERQGWSAACQSVGWEFSFYDGKTSTHHAMYLFRPDIYITDTKYLCRSVQNACKSFNVKLLNVTLAGFPVLGNTFAVKKKELPIKNYVAIFNEPHDDHLPKIQSLINSGENVKIFSSKRWPLNEYAGFLNYDQFSAVCAEAKQCILFGSNLTSKHINVCLAEGELYHEVKNLSLGHDMLCEKAEMFGKLKRFIDHTNAVADYNCNRIPQIIQDWYEQETSILD